jgi:hypothetical protein
MKHTHQQLQGQAMVTVLFVCIIGMLIVTGALYGVYNAIGMSSQSELGLLAGSAAEIGIENALIRFIRDPSYTGETMLLGNDRSVIITSGGTPKTTITATGSVGSITRRIQTIVYYNNDGVFTIESWSDIP